MSEAGAGRHEDEQEGRRGAWRPRMRMRHLARDSPERHLPPVGMEVAGYRLETRLGSGGQGTVFRARREGGLFAVKFIYLPRAARWGWRELDVMVKLWRAGGLPLEGHGLWPAQEPLFLFLVTPFVRGLPLDVWTRVHNPHAREVAELVRQAARLLQVVHEAGVVHRDVKGANLLVCEEGRLVLVDFGVATYESAPEVTGPFPPGTWPYLSPRVWRAWRGEEKSRASPGDDVWALGVELYRLLTGRLPFQGQEGELVKAILHEEPVAPHVLNPRVPRELGEVCQRMLRKAPEERYTDAEVDAALEGVLRGADAAWEVPLCEAWGPQHATTEQSRALWMEGGELVALFERRAASARQPVRGRPLAPDEASTLASPEEEPPGPEAPEEARPPESSEDTARLPEPPEEPPRAGAPEERPSRWRVIAVLGAVLVLGVWLAMRPAPHAPVPTSPVGTPWAHLPPEFPPLLLEPSGQEVAPPGKQPEGDGGAAPQTATLSAPVARATPPQETRVKTPPKTSVPQQPRPKQKDSPAGTVGAVVLSCTLATGCPGPTTPEVRPTPHARTMPLPPPAECPEGAEQSMRELGLLGRRPFSAGIVHFPGDGNFVTVRPGPVTMRLTGRSYWGKLPEGTLLSGELVFGERVQGRFTQAHTPDGHTYTVCLELQDGANFGWKKEPGSGQDTARVVNTADLEPVKRFGDAWKYEARDK
ncbi:protein kinase domain-containing protein [Archangium sp.]|uniref:serine/threonine protein kinase n=1 Tax=Archangium sp. TaxID=1872627 RepID=UPI00286C6BF3|nr:protein kinase [Archangium sp.]